MSLTFVTSNREKVDEAEKILGRSLNHEKLNLAEIQSMDVEEVAVQKAKDAYNQLEHPVLVEDTGLYFEELDGFPGALVKYALKGLGNPGLTQLVNVNKSAEARTVFALYDGDSLKTFEGRVEGMIVEDFKMGSGFGWDPIFKPKGFDKTFGEMSKEKKNEISMRRKALENLRENYF